jgi:hypothetical protein
MRGEIALGSTFGAESEKALSDSYVDSLTERSKPQRQNEAKLRIEMSLYPLLEALSSKSPSCQPVLLYKALYFLFGHN